MRIIEGFEDARAVLSRQLPVESYAISPALGQELQKMFGTDDTERVVRQIIEEVRKSGDSALFSLTYKIDKIKLTSLEITRQQVAAAYDKVDTSLVAALQLAAERICAFHSRQKEAMWHEVLGTDTGQLVRPLERVGVYVPGGTASYPSTVLMTALPAKVAGVREVIMASPPKPDGMLPPATLVAADIAKVDRIFCVGGAQAIAALAYGTDTIPNVDKVCGPGNIFVVLAKKLVFGVVDIDGLQGPSEVLILADETASPEYCAADLLAQAEHDRLASAMMVTTSRKLADMVCREVERQLAGLSRRSLLEEPLATGIIAVVKNREEAIALANLYAPEHLCLMVEDASTYINRLTNAGCIIAGKKATVVMGDYIAGPSHALPTGGTARFGSPLNVLDFVKLTSVVNVDEASLKALGPAAETIARAEGLDAHAQAIRRRLANS